MNESLAAVSGLAQPIARGRQAQSQLRVPVLGELRYLDASEYSLWDSFVDGSPQSSVFCRSWWLQAIGGDVRVLGYFKGGNIVAGMPLYFENRFGIGVCTMPKLTQTWGVVLPPLTGKASSVCSEQTKILCVFADRLAQQRVLSHSFHPTVQNWLPFHWAGLRQTTRYTYVLDLPDLQRVWNTMASGERSIIRKAERYGIKVTPCGPEKVCELEEETFRRQALAVPHTRELIQRLYTAAQQNHSGGCFSATDDAGQIHAACFVVWDRSRANLIVLGSDPRLRSSGANLLLLWHVIQFVAGRSPLFDFSGSMLERIERVWRHLGATQVPYNSITKLPICVAAYLMWRRKL